MFEYLPTFRLKAVAVWPGGVVVSFMVTLSLSYERLLVGRLFLLPIGTLPMASGVYNSKHVYFVKLSRFCDKIFHR